MSSIDAHPCLSLMLFTNCFWHQSSISIDSYWQSPPSIISNYYQHPLLTFEDGRCQLLISTIIVDWKPSSMPTADAHCRHPLLIIDVTYCLKCSLLITIDSHCQLLSIIFVCFFQPLLIPISTSQWPSLICWCLLATTNRNWLLIIHNCWLLMTIKCCWLMIIDDFCSSMIVYLQQLLIVICLLVMIIDDFRVSMIVYLQ